jgi:hypothetical protein
MGERSGKLGQVAPGFGKTLIGLAVGVGILFLAAVLVHGMVWASAKALPWLFWGAAIAFDICVIVLLPLCIFRKTRPWAGTGFFIASYVFGLLLFAFSCIVAFEIWGYAGLTIGLVFAGVGVVPVAFAAALLHRAWSPLLNIVFGIVLTYGTRVLGIYLVSCPQPRSSSPPEESHPLKVPLFPAIIALCFLITAALGRWPYAFYILLRLFVSVTAVYLAYKSAQGGKTAWAWIMGAIALAYNPILPLRMHRADWQVVNVVTCVPFAIFSAVEFRRARREPREIKGAEGRPVGKEPKQVGLRPAIRMPDGTVIVGEFGETHAEIEARMKQPETIPSEEEKEE